MSPRRKPNGILSEDDALRKLMGGSEPAVMESLRISEEQVRGKVRERCENDLGLFGRTFFASILSAPPALFHAELNRELLGEADLLIEAWRGSGKSVLACEIETVHACVYGRTQSDLILSATGASACKRLRSIKNALASNEIRRVFGDQIGPVWNEDLIVTKSGIQVEAKGSGEQIRGDRPQRIKFDDSERDDRVHSDVAGADARAGYERWVHEVVIPSLQPSGRKIVLFTPLSRESFWRRKAEAIDHWSSWLHLRYPAIRPDGSAAWPSMFPLDKLDAIRGEIGSRAFRKEYLLQITDDDAESVFRSNWLNWYGGEADQLKELPTNTSWHTVVTVDSAISKRDTGDYTAITVLMRAVSGEKRGLIFVPECTRGKWSLLQQVEELIEIYRVYRPDIIGIPRTALEKALAEVLRDKFLRSGLPVDRFREIDEDLDKRRRAERITPALERGEVYFNRSGCQDLVREMLTFRGDGTDEHDDQVDSFANALWLQMSRVYPERMSAMIQARHRERPDYMSVPRHLSGGTLQDDVR